MLLPIGATVGVLKSIGTGLRGLFLSKSSLPLPIRPPAVQPKARQLPQRSLTDRLKQFATVNNYREMANMQRIQNTAARAYRTGKDREARNLQRSDDMNFAAINGFNQKQASMVDPAQAPSALASDDPMEIRVDSPSDHYHYHYPPQPPQQAGLSPLGKLLAALVLAAAGAGGLALYQKSNKPTAPTQAAPAQPTWGVDLLEGESAK